jgi:hypothetical protein
MWDPSLDEIIIFGTKTYFKAWRGDYDNLAYFSYGYNFAQLGEKLQIAYNKDTYQALFNPLLLDANGLPKLNWDIDHPPMKSWGID